MARLPTDANPFHCTDHMYAVYHKQSGAVKVGRATDPDLRLKQLQTGSPYELRMWLSMKGAGFVEPIFHALFGDEALRGEWYPAGSMADEVLEEFRPRATDVGSVLVAFGEAVKKVSASNEFVRDAFDPEQSKRETWAKESYDIVANHHRERERYHARAARIYEVERDERYAEDDTDTDIAAD